MKRYTREEIAAMKRGEGKPASPRGALARANSLLSKAQDALGHVATVELRKEDPAMAARLDRVFEHLEEARRSIMHRLPTLVPTQPAQKVKVGAAVEFHGVDHTYYGTVERFENGYAMVRWSGSGVLTGVTPEKLRIIPPGYQGTAHRPVQKVKSHKPAGKLTLGASTDPKRLRLEAALEELNRADLEDALPFDRFKAAMAEAETAARSVGERLQILNRGRGKWYASWWTP